MTTKHKFTKVPGLLGAPSSGRYRYRGVLVVRDPAAAYDGRRWHTGAPVGRFILTGTTRAGLARKIDAILDAQEA